MALLIDETRTNFPLVIGYSFAEILPVLLLLSGRAWHVVVVNSFGADVLHSFLGAAKSNQNMHSFHVVVVVCVALLAACVLETHADEQSAQERKPKVKKDPLDFTENDVNKLFDEWEVRETPFN